MKLFTNPAPASDRLIAGILAAFAALVAGLGLADYAFPGETAHLLSAWQGLEPMGEAKYPLLSSLATGPFAWKPQVLGPLCCAIAVYFVTLFTCRAIAAGVGEEHTEDERTIFSRLGGIVAGALFLFTPAVRHASTHLTPGLFALAWALAAYALLVRTSRSRAWSFVLSLVGSAVLIGLGSADSILFLALLPFFLITAWKVSLRRGGRGYGTTTTYLFVYLFVALIAAKVTHGSFAAYADGQKAIFREVVKSDLFFCVPVFAFLSFVVSLVSIRRAYALTRSIANLAFHAVLSLVVVLSVATAVSPSAILLPVLYAPVLSAACVAFVGGYMASFWLAVTRPGRFANESIETETEAARFRPLGYACGGLLALALVLTLAFDAILSDAREGEFADRLAERLVKDLGPRTWLVTNGQLDSHLRLAAKKAGKELNLVCLQKDDDSAYIESFAALAEEKGLVAYTKSLRDYGLIAFLRDWFKYDVDAPRKVAVFNAPDLWNFAPLAGGRHREGQPELLFFAGAASGKGFDKAAFDACLNLLGGPGRWDSDTLRDETDQLAIKRLLLRRHLGFVATVWACREDEKGRKARNNGEFDTARAHFEKALDIYDYVLTDIDIGNCCALFNALDLIDTVLRDSDAAQARRAPIIAMLEEIKKDDKRRYIAERLPVVYGYIMNPGQVLHQGLVQLNAGKGKMGITQVERAADLLPDAERLQLELGVLAPYYAQERGETNRTRAREMYAANLKRFDAGDKAFIDPDALISLTRLALFQNDFTSAQRMLAKLTETMAAEGYEPDVKYYAIKTSYHLMRGELGEARAALEAARVLDDENAGIYAMMAMTVLRQMEVVDASSDTAQERNERLADFERQFEGFIPLMLKYGPEDPAVLKAQSLINVYRAGKATDAETRRKLLESARESLVRVAARNRSDAVTSDRILGLDIELGRVEDAIARAESILNEDAASALAIYSIGSKALSDGDNEKAQTYLAKAVESAPDNPLMLNDYAELLRVTGQLDEAEKVARHAVEKAPQFSYALDTLASVLMDQRKSEKLVEAEDLARKACALSREGEPRLLATLARILKRRGDKPGAEAALKKAKALLKGAPKDHPFRPVVDAAEDEVLNLK